MLRAPGCPFSDIADPPFSLGIATISSQMWFFSSLTPNKWLDNDEVFLLLVAALICFPHVLVIINRCGPLEALFRKISIVNANQHIVFWAKIFLPYAVDLVAWNAILQSRQNISGGVGLMYFYSIICCMYDLVIRIFGCRSVCSGCFFFVIDNIMCHLLRMKSVLQGLRRQRDYICARIGWILCIAAKCSSCLV